MPPADSDASAAELLALVRGAEDRPWSGYVETRGTLQLPVADDLDDLDDLGSLLGEETRLRGWWRGAEDWRVDRLLTTGESDLVHRDGRTVAWSYERAEAVVGLDPEVRLPRTADLVPPVLGARVLVGVGAGDVRRLPARRVAGVAAPGLRVRPPAPQSSIDHVDLWADPGTGLPLRVDVHATGGGSPGFTTAFREVSLATPPASVTAFVPTAGTEVEVDAVLDIADAADRYAPLRPPPVVGGLRRAGGPDGAVGVYGSGTAQLVAIPLRDREAGALREQLALTTGVVELAGPAAHLLEAGPLGVLLTGREDGAGWLVAGTVTAATLERAAGDLLGGTTVVEDRR